MVELIGIKPLPPKNHHAIEARQGPGMPILIFGKIDF